MHLVCLMTSCRSWSQALWIFIFAPSTSAVAPLLVKRYCQYFLIALHAHAQPYQDESYWNERYASAKEQERPYDWYGPWSYFGGFVAGPGFRAKDEMLVVGCGNSNLTMELAENGFTRITSMDFSEEVIRLQREKFPDFQWVHANVRRMDTFSDGAFDVVLDKGTLDAIRTWKKGPEHREMFSEISRVLRPRGRYVSVSFGKPEQLNTQYYFQNTSYRWDVEVQAVPKYYDSGADDKFYVYTCTKTEEVVRADL